jgi:2-isopropylmalate synthase
MALYVRNDLMGIGTNINTKEITRTSRLVSRHTGMLVQANKAVVGANAFAHESGIHQDGVLKHRQTYEIMTPESVGLESNRMVLGRHSGRHGFKARIEQLGYALDGDELQRAYERFLAVADKKKEVFDEDLTAILEDEVSDVPEVYRLDYLHCLSGTGVLPSATVRIIINGIPHQESAWGDGPVDAVYNAINKIVGAKVELDRYAIQAVTSGTDAIGGVNIRIRANGHVIGGHGTSTDIVEASAKAFIDALNRLAFLQKHADRNAATEVHETV